MRPSVTCYAIPGKGKSTWLLEAFARGARRRGVDANVCTTPPPELLPGAAAFYGVRPAVAHLWQQAKAEGRDWYYLDNAYFDADRERYFRVTKNAAQVSDIGLLTVDLNAGPFPRPQPWRQNGTHIVVCPQSDEFMRVVARWQGDWTARITRELAQLTRRPLRVRPWQARKAHIGASLAADLQDAWALVTHTSAAANEALMAGVPVFVTGACAASPIAMNRGLYSFGRLEERPQGFDHRPQWAEGLKRRQWTYEQIAAGAAWSAWNA